MKRCNLDGLAWSDPTRLDFYGDGNVTVDELLTLVDIALGDEVATVCPNGHASHDGAITIDEILAAVNNALNGCV